MTNEKKPAGKRHASLQPFSRDHHFGLVQARRLIRGSSSGPRERREALSAFLYAWETEISLHFDEEERLLAGLIEAPDRRRLFEEHSRLRALVDEARQSAAEAIPEAVLPGRIGRFLEEHIRWEERSLFPYIERNCADSQLRSLAEETARIEAARRRGGK